MDKISIFILALSSFKRVGDATVKSVLEEVNVDEDILDYNYLSKLEGKKIQNLINDKITNEEIWLSSVEKAKAQMINSEEQGISVINFSEKLYPKNLLKQKKYPLIIYVKGNLSILNNEKTVAIIGTRNATILGKKMNERISKHFYERGYTVVSGLAKGHDAIAHQVGVQMTGKTVAILAHGLDQPVYPKENRRLADEILEAGGAWLSTYPLGQKLVPQFLVARDEWQTSMSNGVIAVETGIKGGTNHALNHGLKQNKPVGMLDHTKFPKLSNEERNNTEQIQGNLKRINDNEVYPLYELSSIEHFDELMQTYYNDSNDNFEKNKKQMSQSKPVKTDNQESNNVEQLGFDF